MAGFSERENIFNGTVRSHRGRTITDIGSSRPYLNFLETLNNATDSRVAIIPPHLEGRPDLIAYAAYGNQMLWWLIVEANSVYDFEVDLKAGTSIVIPQI